MPRTITSLVLLLASLGIACGQGTIRLNFDGPPAMSPGSTLNVLNYSESGMDAYAAPSSWFITRRWSGGPLFPDNGSAYLQPLGANDFWFSTAGTRRPTFSAVSVDLALYSASSLDPVTLQFAAWSYSGDFIASTQFTVTGTVDGLGRPLFQTFDFPPEFSNMHTLSISATGPWSLDNLVIIPEPSTTALLCCGGIFLVGVLLRRSPKH